MKPTDLAVAATNGTHHNAPWVLFIVAAVFLVGGGLNVVRPQTAWHARRWQYANPEAVRPSAAALLVARVLGGVFVVIAVVVLVIAIAHYA